MWMHQAGQHSCSNADASGRAAFLLDGPTPPEEKNGPQRSKAPRGGTQGAQREKTLELANDGLGKAKLNQQNYENLSLQIKKSENQALFFAFVSPLSLVSSCLPIAMLLCCIQTSSVFLHPMALPIFALACLRCLACELPSPHLSTHRVRPRHLHLRMA